MIEWGADVLAGHPHVIEPTERLQKIVKEIHHLSMEISFRTNVETLENIWTERGVVMDITIEKENGKTTSLRLIQHGFHVLKSTASFMGGPAYDYQVFLAENYMPGGPLEHTVDKNAWLSPLIQK